MEPIQKVTEAIDAVTKAVDDPAHDPDPARPDWARHRGKIGELRARMESDVFGQLSALTGALPPEAAQKVKNNVAFLATELAALARASGDEGGSARLLRAARMLGPDGTIADEIEGAIKEPETHVALCRARWSQRHGRFDDGDRILKPALRTAKDPGLRKIMEMILNGSRPLDGAPALFRLNGFGAGIYGERDRRDDGSYITTYCISALFIPIFPLSAYRVKDQGYNSYLFMSREALSPFARGYRWFLLAAASASVVWLAFSSWYWSPTRMASIALDEVAEVEQRGDVHATLAAYDTVFASHGHSLPRGERERSAVHYVELLAGTVPAPLVPAQMDAFERAVARFETLPQVMREGDADHAMLERVAGWADELGTSSEESVRAALHVAERGQSIRGPYESAYASDVLPTFGAAPSEPSDPGRRALSDRARDLHRALGGLLAEEWPLDALTEYVASGPDGAACDAAAPLVREIVGSPSLVIAARTPLEAIARATGDAELRESVVAAIASSDAMRMDAERTEALVIGDPRALEATLARFPGDQETVAALADIARASGRSNDAITRLRALGAPGRLVPAALRSLAAAELDAGNVDAARELLSRQVEPRLGELRDAQQALDRVERGRSEALISQLELGLGPAEIEQRLRYATQDEQREIAMEYLREQLASDPAIAAARERYEAVGPIIPSILQLAMIELQRAGSLSGADRDRALADAERLFLAIQAEGASLPEYHLGLGQVYYRLGRTAEGESELASVLASGDDGLALAVATAYREVGMVVRAREVAEGIYERGATPHAQNAAVFLSVIADRLADVETWLSRADQSAPEVRARLLEARAGRAMESREYAEADRLFAQVAREYESRGDRDQAAINNAAVALQSRYAASGDPAHLDAAIERFERAVRLAPQESLAISNLADAHRFRGTIRAVGTTLGGESAVRGLRLDSTQIDTLFALLVQGPLRETVLAASASDPSLRRASDLTRQEQVLAPRRADAWQRELVMLERTADAAGLRDLDARVARVGAIDESASRREAWERGDYDGDLTTLATRQIDDLDERIARARRGRDAHVLGALLALRATALMQRFVVGMDDADLEAAIAAYRESITSWPEIGAQATLAHSLLLRAALADPDLRTRWTTERRSSTVVFVVRRAIADDASVGTRFRAHADAREAGTILAGVATEHLRLDDLAAAAALGDTALLARAEAVRAREHLAISVAIDQRLDPTGRDAADRIALLAAR